MKKPLEQMKDRDWRIMREDNDIQIRQGKTPFPFRSWQESKLPDVILSNLEYQNYKQPLAIQMQAVATGLLARDMLGLAPTGSGKTCAFLLPLVSWLLKMPPLNMEQGPYAIILCPSRELAI